MSETMLIDAPDEITSRRADLPICVDLDGTLVRTDCLVEGVLALGLGRQLLRAFSTLAQGRAVLKAFIAREAVLRPELLPYNETLLAWLQEQRARGRRLVLATAADLLVAHAIADHLGLFDEVIASDGVRNNKSTAKAEKLAQRFGRGGFTYVGDSRSDLAVWQVAASGVTVNASAGVVAAARRLIPLEAEIDDRTHVARAALRALRPYQWVKNLLVFVPIFTAHALDEGAAWAGALAMFMAFCATASGIYLVNDLSDLAADRSHHRKRHRPFASGALALTTGLAMAPVLLILGLALATVAGAVWVILLYAAMSLSYSIKLKEMPLVDVFMLTGLYTIRLVGGGVATGHVLSLWLLAFSSFIFLSLALVKRVEELTELGRTQGRTMLRRGYYASDAAILQLFGCCASFASCIVLALFVQSEAATTRYASPGLLWGIVPLMLFWQCRLWLSTARGYMHDDPIIYAARDWVSWIVAILAVTILMAAHSSFVTGWFGGVAP